MSDRFLTQFPNHVYRYIDLTGQGRAPKSCKEISDSLNLKGYESYFTVNGFGDVPNAQKDNCTNLNAFFVDIDGRKDLEELEEIKVKFNPTFITETQNGYHVYWLLDEPIFKNKCSDQEWEEVMAKWERIELAIVAEFNADPVVKDIPRILRVPRTYYWKKTGNQWTKGTDGVFKIKGLYKNLKNRYSMDDVEKIIDVTPASENLTLPTAEKVTKSVADAVLAKSKKFAEAERANFFERVNEEYPIEERDSFKELISNSDESMPPSVGRNTALHVTACLMR